MSKPLFPADFLWGASTSAHQHEGGNHNQWTEWEDVNALAKATQAPYVWDDLANWSSIAAEASKASNYRSGRAADHYNRYKTDFAIARKLNLNAFRFSIEWSRIEPREGEWDAGEIEQYRQYLAELRRQGLAPVVTLFHFTLPVWFAKKGGFEYRRNIKYFVRFVEKITSELGAQFQYVTIINEPLVYANEGYVEGHWPPNQRNRPRALQIVLNLITAHNRSARVIKKLQPHLMVTSAHNVSWFYAGDRRLMSRLSRRVLDYVVNQYFLKRTRRHSDLIAINYYFSSRVVGFGIDNLNKRVNDLGWEMLPGNIEHVLSDLARRYKKPILITENGVADADDQYRQWWLTETMKAMARARRHGVDLVGYIHWSLLDNFEWDKGFWPRFGLVAVDYKTQKRRVRPSAKWWAGKIAEFQNSSSR